MSAIEQRQVRPAQSRDIVNWITGTGLLVVNAALFFAALVIMIPWNLYSNPGDLWVADPLRKWAFVLAFHALVVGALLLVRSLLDDGTSSKMNSAVTASWTTSPRQAMSATVIDPVPYQQPTASSVSAEEWARKWLAETETDVSNRSSAPSEGDNAGSWSAWKTPAHTEPTELEFVYHAATVEPAPPLQRSPDHMEAAARIGSSPTAPDAQAIDEDLEWQWIEAAASAWLAKRDHEVSPDQR